MEQQYTLKEVASSLNITPQTLNGRLDTQAVKREYIQDIAKAMRVDISYFGKEFVTNKEIEATISQRQVTTLLPTAAKGGSLADFSSAVDEYDCEKIISPIFDADFAITITGDSMAPEYPNGGKILIKKINEKAFIDWGRVYVLDTVNGAIIKKIMPSENEDRVRCVSFNSDYPEFEVKYSDMFGMYRVLMLLTEK